MNWISGIFHTLLYQPLFNTLVLLYVFLPGGDLGIAVIVLTLLLRFVFYPLSAQAARAQKKLSALQPKIKEIQERWKKDRERQAKEMLELYRKENINPLAGLFPLLIQLPVLIALYRVFWNGFDAGQLSQLYAFVPDPGGLNPVFLGLVSLNASSWVVAGIAGAFQFFQAKQMLPSGDAPSAASSIQKQMAYLFPAFTVFIVGQLPSAVGVYWITTSAFTIWQQWVINKQQEREEKLSRNTHDGTARN